MDLRNVILEEHSKKQCTKIVEWVGNSQEKFNELFHLFLNGEYRTTQRAGWPLSYCVIKYPCLMNNNYEKLINNLKRSNLHDSIKRNTVRLLQAVDIPLKYEGAVMEICFKYLESPNEAVAIKAFSITVLGKLAKKYPEIIPEIKLMIRRTITTSKRRIQKQGKTVYKIFCFRINLFYCVFSLQNLLP